MVSFSLCNARCITAWAACETTRARDEGSLVSPDVCNQREGVCRAACEGGDAHLEAVVEAGASTGFNKRLLVIPVLLALPLLKKLRAHRE
jgi:hypothetical protein